MNLTSHQLLAFLHLANTGSFSEAAKLQGVSQPSLSRTIQHIERVVGRRLFDRTTKQVRLTGMATELRPIAERLVGEFTGASSELARFVDAAAAASSSPPCPRSRRPCCRPRSRGSAFRIPTSIS